jgi:DNA repair protein RecN (Recombination protein N)
LDAAADLAALEATEQAAHKAFMAEARKLGKARALAAPKLAASITQAMQALGMQGGRFEVALEALPEPASHGLEEVQFLVAGHAGSTPRPVGKGRLGWRVVAHRFGHCGDHQPVGRSPNPHL